MITATWIVYPRYRTKVPTRPKSILLANPNLAEWHKLINKQGVRRVLMVIFTLAFTTAAVAGLFGAFIARAAPVRQGR